MSRVRNAYEFRHTYIKACELYNDRFRPQLDKLRRQYAKGANATVDESLEIHIREYKINALLAALNWRLDNLPEVGLPNVFIEVPLESRDTERIRFLDYFGLERETDRPLILIEAKRPSIGLPGLTAASKGRVVSTLSEVISLGLRDEPLSGDWSAWLRTLRDYVQSIHAKGNEYPKRLVITNGKWIIVFLDVPDAFADGGDRDACRILVFTSHDEVSRRSAELFDALEYGIVSGDAGWLTVDELRFKVSASEVAGLSLGLRLRYHEEVRVFEILPEISVAPVVFLWFRYGGSVRIHAPQDDYEIPRNYSELSTHLADVGRAAINIEQQVKSRLEITLEPSPLPSGTADEGFRSSLGPVVEPSIDEFAIVTGDRNHFLLTEPSVPGCPYHDWEICRESGVASNPGPILKPSVLPRSFFVSGQAHHCAHREVASAKSSPITETNRDGCGVWSGEERTAFCKIWLFETYLCCRACVFEEVCTRAEVFRLPCQRQNHVGQ